MHANCFGLYETENSASCIPNFRIFSLCWVSGLLRCDALSLSVRVATFPGTVLCLSLRVKQARTDCVQAHISWLDLQITPDIRLRSLATAMKQRYKSKGSTVSHHSRRRLLKLKYIKRTCFS